MTYENRHTPGPWEIHNGTYAGYLKRDICSVYCTERLPTEDGLGAEYCTIVGPPADHNAPPKTFKKQNLANAHLIASAPELLDALENLYHMRTGGISNPQAAEDILDAALQVIKKARGIQ